MPIFNMITYSPADPPEAYPPEAYAVFDSSDGSFTFFRDDKGKYTDGQVSGTKTYYTGFEDITGSTVPSWCTSDRSGQKNTIKTVTFKDKIQPKTCYRWFIGANSLTSITRLYKLDTENVTSISRMFQSCSKLTSPDLSDFNTENVTDMGLMFAGCSSLTSLDLSSFNTAKVTNMDTMFQGCSNLTSLNLSSFNTANVTNMYRMFQSCSKLTSPDLSDFNTENVTDMGLMFAGCSSLTSLDLSSFNTAKVTDMYRMFQGCSNLTSLDLSSFNTAKVTNMDTMFAGCSSLKTIYASSLFTTNAVSSSESMFYNNTSLVGGAGTKFDTDHIDKTYARIDGGTSNPGYFTARQAYAVYDSTDQSMTFFKDTPGKYTDGQVSGTKTYYTGFEDITGTATPSWYDSDNSKQKNTIKTVVFKDKISPKTCYRWFFNATSLTSITGLDKLDTASVTNMNFMFQSCSSLTSLNLSSFNTANVTKMNRMFTDCVNLTSLDVSSFNTGNVMNMNYMFYNCYSLTSLDVSGFNTASVTNMSYMFYNCSKLKTIYASSLFTTDAVSSSNSMFYYCSSLVGGAGTKYNANHIDKTYARIDGGTSNPGYFTAK